MKRLLAALLLASSISTADNATQTDWSGGPCEPGPVTVWGSDFSSDAGIDWMSLPGAIILDSGLQQENLGSRGCCQIRPADLDGDGDLDIAGSCNWTDAVCWWENDILSDTWIEHVVQSGYQGPEGLACADLDGDGDFDIAAASDAANDISWWENDGSGTSWTRHFLDNPVSKIRTLDAEDIDADGDIDLAGCIEWADQVAWWENDGSGQSWTRHVVANSFDTAWEARCEDIDGDGSMDIVACARTGNTIAWWDNTDGSGTSWAIHVIATGFYDPRCVTTGDVDGDGDIDVLGTSFSSGDVVWWSNEGGSGSAWSWHVIDPALQDAHGISTGDFDDDGDNDVIATSLYPNDVAWWRNLDGQGTSWEKNWLTQDLEQARCTACADVDGDGTLELFSAGWYASMMWDSGEYMPNGALMSSILYTGNDPDWDQIQWSAETPPGTLFGIQVRASDNPAQMGTWSATLWSPCSLHGLLADNSSYVQYRAIMISADPGATPALNEVTVTWDALGVGESESPSSFELSPVTPNPARGPVTLCFGLPASSQVELFLLDMAGRLVRHVSPSEYQPGWHSMQLDGLLPGIYFARFTAGGDEASERFVVIE